MDALKSYNPKAHEDLLRTEPKTWCRAFFSSYACCEDVCNNLSESFNRTIKEARKLPIISMLEEVRRLAMKRITRRREKTSKCLSKFPPSVMSILESNRKLSRFCSVLISGENLYEVQEGSQSFEVFLLQKHCACNQWNLTGVPCPHAIHVLTKTNCDPKDYVDPRLQTSIWQANYEKNIKPVNGDRMWKRTGRGVIEIPDKRKQRGRPKKYARIKEPTESSANPTKATRDGRIMTCSNCKKTGHNKGTCKSPPVQSAPTRKRGRPRKHLVNDDPWSIENAPNTLRWRNDQPRAQTQCTQPASQGDSTTDNPLHSSAPAGNPSSTAKPRGRPKGSKNGCGVTKAIGRGRGKAKESPTPKQAVFFMSPFTDQVFDVWRPENP